eukprot:477467_1
MTAIWDLRVLKQVDDRTHKAVCGYIHEIEKLFVNHVIIPHEIVNICILFCFDQGSYSSDLCGKNIYISDNGKTASIITSKSNWQCVFTSSIIRGKYFPDSIFEWIFKINPSTNSSTIAEIGILSVDNNNMYNDTIFNSNPFYDTNTHRDYYALYFILDGGFRGCIQDTNNSQSKVTNNWTNTTNDLNLYSHFTTNNQFRCPASPCENTITMQIDALARTIRYEFNNKEYGIAFKNIKIFKQYQTVVCFYDHNTSMQIKSFRVIDIFPSNCY